MPQGLRIRDRALQAANVRTKPANNTAIPVAKREAMRLNGFTTIPSFVVKGGNK
jgi:hypothetical protein